MVCALAMAGLSCITDVDQRAGCLDPPPRSPLNGEKKLKELETLRKPRVKCQKYHQSGRSLAGIFSVALPKRAYLLMRID